MDERKINSFRGTERNYGIDLLRLLAMLMVVVVHIANQGGASTCADGVKRYAVAAIEYMAICCVDVYAVIIAVCLAAEKLRLWLFKVTRFDDLLDFSGNKIDGIVDGTFSAKE